MSRDLDAVLASIDGALADDEFPDAMRWSPEPETVDAPAPFDGETVYVGPEERSSTYDDALDYDPALPISPRNFPLITARRGGIRFPRPDEVIGHVDRVVEDEDGIHVEGTLNEAGRSILDQIVAPLADAPVVPSTADPLGDLIRATEALRRRGVDPLARRPMPHRRGVPPEHANARCEVRPVYRGPVVRHLILDEAFLVEPAHRAEVVSDREDAARRIVEQIGGWMNAAVEAFATVGEQVGKVLAGIAPRPEPPRSLRETDPRAYALQLRQSRGTGPDRQVQRQHRPRRHS